MEVRQRRDARHVGGELEFECVGGEDEGFDRRRIAEY